MGDTDNFPARLAVQEDRMERSHRDITEIKNDIRSLFKLLREHMRKEEEERESERNERIAQTAELVEKLNDMNTKITAVDNQHKIKWAYVTGIVGAVSALWAIAGFIAKIAGWI